MDAVTVWAALQTTQAVQYGIPYIDANTLQPTVDALNLAWKTGAGVNLTGTMHVAVAGDLTGTDAINAGAQVDSYMPTTLQDTAVVGKVAGHVVSASRGNRTVPTVVLAGDLIGIFSAFGYTGVSGSESYKELTGIKGYVRGASLTDPGGGLRLGTKVNDGIYTEHLELDDTGQLFSIVNGAVKLGKSNQGFKGLHLDYTNSATVGAVTINKPAGSVNIAAGASSVVVTNNLVTAASLVIPFLMQTDATLTFLRACIPAAGSFTINGNANATANCKIGFVVINTD